MHRSVAIRHPIAHDREAASRHQRLLDISLGALIACLGALLVAVGVSGLQAFLADATPAGAAEPPAASAAQPAPPPALPREWQWQQRAVDFDSMIRPGAVAAPRDFVMDRSRRAH